MHHQNSAGHSYWFKYLAKSALLSIGIQIAFALISFLTHVMLARILGKTEYGGISIYLALGMTLSMLAAFGLPTLVTRETAKLLAVEDWGSLRGLWGWASAVALGISFLFIVVALIIQPEAQSAQDRDYQQIGLLICLFVPLISLSTVWSAAIRGLSYVVIGQLPERVFRPAITLFMLGIVMLPFLAWPFTADFAFSVFVISALVSLMLNAWLFSRYIPIEVAAAQSHFKARVWAKAALPMGISGGMFVLIRYTDIMMLGYLTSKGAVGIYNIAVQVSMLSAFALVAINMITGPKMAVLYKNGEKAALQNLATVSCRMVTLYSAPALLLFWLFGEWFIEILFGSEYLDAYWPTLILLTGQLLNSITGPVANLLNMAGHERRTAFEVAIGMFVNVALNLVLIPIWGAIGAAIASVLATCLWNGRLWWYCFRSLQINCAVISK